MNKEISFLLNTEFIGREVNYFDTIDSTNTYAKTIGSKALNGTLIISEEQTGGRGRLGRGFVSPKYKGIWMSIILKPDINPQNAAKLTQVAAAAVVSAIQEQEIDARVKWPNDILINGKKCCGILTEMKAEPEHIDYVIVGIGINVNLTEEDFNDELRDIATSLLIEKGNIVDREEFLSSVLNNFEKLYIKFVENNDFKTSLKICSDSSALIGKKIRIINRNNTAEARALGLDEEGGLIVQYTNGACEHLISGEVSIRI